MYFSDVVLQTELPIDLQNAAAAPIPRMQPVEGSWLTIDDAYAGQMALKRALIADRRDVVLQQLPHALPACQAALHEVIAHLKTRPEFVVDGDHVHCPDDRVVQIDIADPLVTLSQLIQEDICILHKEHTQHVLVAGLLCFPASWSLSEKIGRPLSAIHDTVPEYDPLIAARVQRMFNATQPGRPIWRANLFRYDAANLHTPRTEDDARPPASENAPFWRSERQTVNRLADSDVVMFSIHTTMTAAR